jgi:uncharacterized integral membrane protein
MKWIKTLLGTFVFIFAVLFSIQNREEVAIRFVLLPIQNYQWFEVPKVPLPLFLIILCSVFLGVLIGGIGDLYSRLRLKKTIRQNQKIIERMEKEIQSLRGPLLDQPSFLKEEN